MWDQRYRCDDYIYGTEPNDFLRENFSAINGGKVLCLAEGEGRNAVFLARQGYAVTAVDASAVGLAKGTKLAACHGVEVEWVHADLAEFELGHALWDGIVSVFCHLPAILRRDIHRQVVAALKPQGVFILEAYTPDQIGRGTGGPPVTELMMSAATLKTELHGLHFRQLREIEREVLEGSFHSGVGAVVQLLAAKAPASPTTEDKQ